MASSAAETILGTERRVLQALCLGTPEGPVLEAGKRILKNYPWRDPLHRVIFELLAANPSASSAILREQLPALTTRRGFPDVSWDEILRPSDLSKLEAERLMEYLVKQW